MYTCQMMRLFRSVTWEEARDYARWLSSHTGQRYRLLSEAEWEYVARAGSDRKFGPTDDLSEVQANCSRCRFKAPASMLTPARSYPPNAWGVHNMIGNVSEWTVSCPFKLHGDHKKALEDSLNNRCQYRILRGGSSAGYLSASNLGFRVGLVG